MPDDATGETTRACAPGLRLVGLNASSVVIQSVGRSEPPRNLEGDTSMMFEIDREVDRSHTSLAKLPLHLIPIVERFGEPAHSLSHPDGWWVGGREVRSAGNGAKE